MRRIADTPKPRDGFGSIPIALVLELNKTAGQYLENPVNQPAVRRPETPLAP
jgi:hypothetical protein